jgi:hypothetical protein
MGNFSDFQRGQIVGALLLLAGTSVTKTATLLDVSKAVVLRPFPQRGLTRVSQIQHPW